MSLRTISINGALAVSAPADQPLLGIKQRLASGPVLVEFYDVDSGQAISVSMIPAEASPARTHPSPQRPSD